MLATFWKKRENKSSLHQTRISHKVSIKWFVIFQFFILETVCILRNANVNFFNPKTDSNNINNPLLYPLRNKQTLL